MNWEKPPQSNTNKQKRVSYAGSCAKRKTDENKKCIILGTAEKINGFIEELLEEAASKIRCIFAYIRIFTSSLKAYFTQTAGAKRLYFPFPAIPPYCHTFVWSCGLRQRGSFFDFPSLIPGTCEEIHEVDGKGRHRVADNSAYQISSSFPLCNGSEFSARQNNSTCEFKKSTCEFKKSTFES
jgi:hypothetical protein